MGKEIIEDIDDELKYYFDLTDKDYDEYVEISLVLNTLRKIKKVLLQENNKIEQIIKIINNKINFWYSQQEEERNDFEIDDFLDDLKDIEKKIEKIKKENNGKRNNN